MHRVAPWSLLLLGLLAVPIDHAGRAAEADVIAPGLRPGMTPKQVRAALGRPAAVSRQVVLFRVLEQWHYTRPSLRITFDRRRGEPPRLLPPDAGP